MESWLYQRWSSAYCFVKGPCGTLSIICKYRENFDSESLIQLGLIIVNVPMVKMINCALNHPPLWTKMLWLPTLPPSFHQKQRLKVPGPCTDSNSGFHTSRIFSWLSLASCSVLICARGDCFRREGGEFTCAFESGLLSFIVWSRFACCVRLGVGNGSLHYLMNQF